MKKGIAAIILALAVLGSGWAQQQAVVAIAPFEARSGISMADAATITEIYSVRLAAAKSVRVVTRDNLDKVIREHSFQMSDWSDDKKTAELGKALNADWVVRGILQKLVNSYIVTATILDVKTLEIMGGADMKLDSIESAYDNMGPFVAQTVQTLTGSGGVAVRPGQRAEDYEVGDYGPAGGWIFYDKGRVSNGWRYLEAAPSEAEFTAPWGTDQKNVERTSAAVGTGRRNTELIVDFLRRNGETNRAAQLCDSLSAGGYDDWFLPSKDELNLMYTNLKARDLGEFSNNWYWSSSESMSNSTWNQSFSDGNQYSNYKGSTYSVRAVRAF
jgi:TolB-like protein